jgi:HEAT repeat protein/lysophospholipase L1-like esterase
MPRSPRAGLAANLLLSAAVTLLLLAVLEGGGRVWERTHPPPATARYLWNWQDRWDGEFYTVASGATGWPPDEEFNVDGVRDRTHAEQEPEGVRRLVFLGDSVTLGAGVEPSETYPAELQRRLRDDGHPVEVFNVALWGWSTRQERLAYQKIARRYGPDHVVLAVCLNDLAELQNNLARPPGWLAALHRRSAFVRALVNAQGREIQEVEQLFTAEGSRKVEEAYGRFFEEVRALRADVEGDGASFALLVFPFRFQVLPQAPEPRAQQRILGFCAAEKLACHDMLPALLPLGAAGFVDYDHLSPAGTRATAEELRRRPLWAPTPSLRAELPEDPEVADLAALLGDPGPARRAAAAWALAARGEEAAEAVPALGRALGDPSERVRALAAEALAAAGPAATPAVPALLDRLDDERQAVRWSAARALHAIGTGPEAQPALVKRLSSGDAYIRAFAAFAIGQLGRQAEGAAGDLVAALRREEGRTPGRAAQAVGQVPAAVRQAVAELSAELKDPSPARRQDAARALGKLGPRAQAAGPALAGALADAEVAVREEVAIALGRLGASVPAAAGPLAVALRDPDRRVQVAAARSIGKMGVVASAALPELRLALRADDVELRALAARAIGMLGPAAAPALPDLERASRDPEGEVARQAAKALKRLRRGGA